MEISRGSAVRVEGLWKRFGERAILRDFTACFDDEKITTIAGPSGVGKSTLLRILAGLDQDYTGEVSLRGRRSTTLRPEDRGVAMLFQQAVLYPHLTVLENICFPLVSRGVNRGEATRIASSFANVFAAEAFLHRHPTTLSGGERQRAALARAFASGGRIRLLDEPVKASLEPELRLDLRRAIRTLQTREGGCTIVVTHDQEEALELSDSILLMLQEHKSYHLPASMVYESPPTLDVARFFGGGTLVRGGIDSNSLTLEHSGIRLRVDRGRRRYDGLSRRWLLRAEALIVKRGGEFKVEQVYRLGATMRLEINAPVPSGPENGILFTALAESNAGIDRGDGVDLAIDESRLLGFDDVGRRVEPCES